MTTLRRFLAVAGLAALLVGAAATPAQAEQLYGVSFFNNQLFTVSTTTGHGSLVGPLDSPPVSPFGLSSVDGKLYTFDSNAELIRQIDPATGGTLATYDIGIGPVLGQGGLAFEDANVGFLTSALDPSTLSVVNDLYRFDLATGTTTLIGHTSDTLEAIAFGPGGTLYGLGKLDGDLYTVDPTTADLTLVGNVGINVGSPTGGLAFKANGMLYTTLDDKLYTLNTMTGMATPVGSSDSSDYTGFNTISGLAFGPQAVPEPGSIVLMGLGVAGLLALRRFRVG